VFEPQSFSGSVIYCVFAAQTNQPEGSGVDECYGQVALGVPVHGLASTAQCIAQAGP
jgi:hypothetical protein